MAEARKTTKAAPKQAAKTKLPDPNVAQRQASDPQVSAWVTASAGTGKTKVLTDRVLRLLLNGSDPRDILCITFTKAAATVMNNRIQDKLGNWAIMDEKDLVEELTYLGGRKPTAKTVAQARRLFAEVSEVPGGMKIQTIHSFSQALLKRFPIEAQIPPYFNVMDEETSAELLKEVQGIILQDAKEDPDSTVGQALLRVTTLTGDQDFIPLLQELAEHRSELQTMFDRFGGLDGALDAVYDYLKIPAEEDSESLIAVAVGQEKGDAETGMPDEKTLRDAAEALLGGSKTDAERGRALNSWLDKKPEDRARYFESYANLFLTATGAPRKTLITKTAAAKAPGVEDTLAKESERMLKVLDRLKAHSVAQSTEALLTLADAMLIEYKEQKNALTMLDFDDLIHRTAGFLSEDDNTAWALQKLDGNLQHILIDEAQDTNPEQWQVVAGLTREFFHGKTRRKPARDKPRTMFVVGDEKQSIFSFQNADPQEFERRQKMFKDEVEKAGGKWRKVDLGVSFRSSPAVLNTVDAVFKNDEARDGLSFGEDKEVHHHAWREGHAGEVVVEPLVEHEDAEPSDAWTLPTQYEPHSDAVVTLANNIADKISDWLENGEELEARGRPISPGDIMVLVRRRSDFVDHLVRALKHRDVPVAGADRMALREQLAVLDLVKLGEFAMLPENDMALAEVLKSPIIGMNDKQLEYIAIDREGSLWDSLCDKAKHDPFYRTACDYLKDVIADARGKKPYEFYAHLLFNPSPADERTAARGIFARLGQEAEDPLVEFLNAAERFENGHTPTVQGFLKWLEDGQAEVKREMDLTGTPQVRIMTTHGAKGLEAPIVILPDTTGVPSDNTKARPRLLWPDRDGKRPVVLWSPRSDMEDPIFAAQKQAAELERDREYRRLMYVAMTRAEDRLIVTGYKPRRKMDPKSWYSLIAGGMAENMADKIEVDDKTGAMRFKVGQTAKPKDDGVTNDNNDHPKPDIPDWATRREDGQREDPIRILKPSDAKGEHADEPARSPLKDSFKGRRHWAIEVGDRVHELLEFLPIIPKDHHEEVIEKYLARPGWDLKDFRQKQIKEQLMNILEDKEFGDIFGPNSRAEVALAGLVGSKRMDPHLLTGKIDRLVVKDDEVLIVDYKTSARYPEKVEDVRETYVDQLAAYRFVMQQVYPGKKVKCALLWTAQPGLMPIPDKKLDAAYRKIERATAERKKREAEAARAQGLVPENANDNAASEAFRQAAEKDRQKKTETASKPKRATGKRPARKRKTNTPK